MAQPLLKPDRPRINVQRLWHDIHYTAQWGAIPNSTGMSRLALTDSDKHVRDWFATQAEELGCDVKCDNMGNIFAVLPGKNSSLPPIAMGSHLDTQPNGGRYDGVLGVIGALEVLRTVKESGIQTHGPIAAVNWTNEEGARFLSGCTGSAVWSGWRTLSFGHGLRSRLMSTDIKTELARINYLGSYPCFYAHHPLSAHFELHIEQHTRLEKSAKLAGVVTRIQGIRWYTATVTGEQGHAGSTPMDKRADAFVAVAKIVLLVEALAVEHSAFATVGRIESEGCSSNTIPGTASFTIDLRHRSDHVVNEMESRIRMAMAELEFENPKLKFKLDPVWESPAVHFDGRAVSCVRAAAIEEVGEDLVMEMKSFAGHDSALTATKIPTAMLFVPSKDGISHAPEEFTSEEDWYDGFLYFYKGNQADTIRTSGHGVQILLNAVLKYDAMLGGSSRIQL